MAPTVISKLCVVYSTTSEITEAEIEAAKESGEIGEAILKLVIQQKREEITSDRRQLQLRRKK